MGKYLIIILLTIPTLAFGQEADTTIILIEDMNVQVECTQGLNYMYNFKFDRAEGQFRYLKQKYIWHPLPYFLLGLNEWWKIMPDLRNTEHDETFIAYMDTVIMISENLFKQPEHKIEASFFLSAAYGFKGRLYSDENRKNWRKATVVGAKALDYLEVSKDKPNLSPELLFGDALYNYFSHWIPENYPILKPVMLLFPKGDKELGIQQLREVSFNAFYTRTEAMVWLMRILHNYENDPRGAFYVGEYLYETYPDNAYFHRYYARLLYSSGRYSEAMKESELIIQRIDSGMIGYESNSGRYAAFFLGHINQMRGDIQAAKKYYDLAVIYSQQGESTDTGFYFYAMLYKADIIAGEGNKKEARDLYKEVKKEAPRSHSAYKVAKDRLSNM